jgi:tetratricopeptide (TPR) repeat protein
MSQIRVPFLDHVVAETLVARAVAAYEHCDYDTAIADLSAAISAVGRNPGLLYDRGLIFEAAGRPEEAISDYTRALRIPGSDRAELLYRRGRCLLALGRIDDATCDLKAHLAIGASPYEQDIARLLGIRPYRRVEQVS